MRIIPLLALGLLSLLVCGLTRAAEPPLIAAAADLKFALTDIADRFAQRGATVSITYGSSGTFNTQIAQGAPFQMFLSADENFVFQLADAGLTQDRGVLYAIGRLVLFAPHGSRLPVDAKLSGLKVALAHGQIQRFAIANPEHAPYGRAARAALQSQGLWSSLETKLVFGENAAQAMQFSASGSSDGGIVPLSLSKVPAIAKLGSFALLPAAWHSAEPLHQRMVLLKNANAIASDFFRYLQTPAAREVFIRYGFALPDDRTP